MSKRPNDLHFRFWSRILIDPETGCWNWVGYKGHGYGYMTRGGGKRGSMRVHRWSWEQVHGPIPEGLVPDHLCRNRACANPAHLELVTQGENILRGIGVAAVQARKTHCIRGHDLSAGYITPGRRRCRVCRRGDGRPNHHRTGCPCASCARRLPTER
jgi:hypothetical protein